MFKQIKILKKFEVVTGNVPLSQKMAFSIVILTITVLWIVTGDHVTINSNNGTITTLKLRQMYYALQGSQWWFRHRFSNFLDCTAESFRFGDVS